MFKKILSIFFLLLFILTPQSFAAGSGTGIPVHIVSGGIDTELVVDHQIRTMSQNYYDGIVDNKVTGHTSVNKFGYNALVGASEEVIWTYGNGYTYLTAAETLKVSSSDAADDGDPVGTGARTVTIEGYTTGYVAATDTVTLNGVGSVDTTVLFLRVDRAYVATAGSGETNAGLISIKDNADTVVLAEIVIGRGQTQMAMKTVATGKTFFMTQSWVSESANKKVRARIYYIDRSVSNGAWRLKDELVANLGDSNHNYELPLVFVGPMDIQIRGYAATPSADVNAGFEGYEE